MDHRLKSARHIVRRKRIKQLASARRILSAPKEDDSRTNTKSRSRAITARATTARNRNLNRSKLPSLDHSPDSIGSDSGSLSPYDIIPPVRRRPSTAGNTSSEINDAYDEIRRQGGTLPMLNNGEDHPYPYYMSEDAILSADEPRAKSAPSRQHLPHRKLMKKSIDKFRMDNKFAKGYIIQYIEDVYVKKFVRELIIDCIDETDIPTYDLSIRKSRKPIVQEDDEEEETADEILDELIKVQIQMVAWSHVEDLSEQMSMEHYRMMSDKMGDKLALYENEKAAMALLRNSLTDSNRLRDSAHKLLKEVSMASAVYNWYKAALMAKTVQNYGYRLVHNKINNSEAVGTIESHFMKEMNKHLEALDSKETRSTPPR